MTARAAAVCVPVYLTLVSKTSSNCLLVKCQTAFDEPSTKQNIQERFFVFLFLFF